MSWALAVLQQARLKPGMKKDFLSLKLKCNNVWVQREATAMILKFSRTDHLRVQGLWGVMQFYGSQNLLIEVVTIHITHLCLQTMVSYSSFCQLIYSYGRKNGTVGQECEPRVSAYSQILTP